MQVDGLMAPAGSSSASGGRGRAARRSRRAGAVAGVLVPSMLAVVGIGLLAWWATADWTGAWAPRLPGQDGAPSPDEAPVAQRPEPGEPIRGEGSPSAIAAEWPWFRGPNLDAISPEAVPLARRWPVGGPRRLWQVELGQGYAGAVVRDGCVYLLDYDETAKADTMRCLSLDDGREIWSNAYPVVVSWNHGMSRTVSAMVGDGVISLGPMCHVTSWDAQTGQARWLIDLVLDHGAKVPPWYAGQCPLIDDGRLILAPGGDALVMAVDVASGEPIWRSENPRRWAMTHTSIVPMEYAGRRTYVYCGTGGVAGVAADDGAILWETNAWRIDMATCPSPVVVGEGRIFLCGGYNSGAMMLRLVGQGDAISAEVEFRLRPREFSSEQHTPVPFDGHLFGVRQADKRFVCLDLDGNEVWNSGGDKFGAGPYMIADGLIYVMDDDGVLTMAEATAEAYRPLDRAEVIDDGHDAWAPMALVAGRLILRDMTRMVCLEVSEP